VYILFGTSEETGEDVAYIGQADVRKNGSGVLGRLQEHKRDPSRDYWTEAVVLVTSNDSLGATEISWLESEFCSLAKKANRYTVKNGNEPSPGKPKEEIISELVDFAGYATLIMGVLGHKIFEPKAPVAAPGSNAGIDDRLYYCRRSGVEANGKPTSDGFVVLADSRVSLTVADYVSKGDKELRKRYASIVDANGVLGEDVVFTSPSAASTFVIGKNSNGLVEWKTEDGKTLKDVEASEG
jgi:hypothetical protein